MSDTHPTRKALGVILLTVFLDLVGFSIIFPLFPDMLEFYLGQESSGGALHRLITNLERMSGFSGEQASLAATVLFGGLLGSLYSVLQFIASPIWGTLSDRRGRRGILLITTTGTAVGYLLWVFSGSFTLLVLSRLVNGVMAGNLSVATAAVADVTDDASRSKGMGMIGAAFGIGFIIGPAMGALLSRWDLSASVSIPGINPFSGPALVALCLAVANAVWVWRSFAETCQPADSVRDLSGQVRRPLNPFKLLQPFDLAGVNRVNFIYFIYIVAFAGMEFTLTFLAKDRFHYTAAQQGYIFLFIGIIIAVVQGGLIRRLAPKYGEKKLVLVGLGLVLPGLSLVAICQSQSVMYLGLFFLGVGSSLVTPSLTALVSLYSPDARQGEVLGVFRSIGSLGRAFAPIVAALIYWRFGSAWPYAGSAVILLFPYVLAMGLPLKSQAP